MSLIQQLVLASNNLGKLREFDHLLGRLGIKIVNQASLGISEAEEPHCSFLENALAKARHAAAQSGLPALADDSGLCVDVLKGAPGVASAVYGSMPSGQLTLQQDRHALRVMQDRANNSELLRQLEPWPLPEQRRAYYVCVLVLVRHREDPLPVIAQGIWAGQVLAEPTGEGGFGYDPLFWLPEHQCSVAQLDLAEKNRVSHRAQALLRLARQLQYQGLAAPGLDQAPEASPRQP